MAKIILIATFLLLSCFSFQSKEFLGKNVQLFFYKTLNKKILAWIKP